ncbi:hypothetical protein EYF80_026935 [Liparis tanakae]|uniref:Uncharacterized protein n=1 Tax=Liparis tanakae TaxID=230148 RepID=A0A4Z2HBF7_9TELE|nr:hypothetical protein EYF80_026935 [Liparis tanakae]
MTLFLKFKTRSLRMDCGNEKSLLILVRALWTFCRKFSSLKDHNDTWLAPGDDQKNSSRTPTSNQRRCFWFCSVRKV